MTPAFADVFACWTTRAALRGRQRLPVWRRVDRGRKSTSRAPVSIAGSDSRFGWECDSLSTRRGSNPGNEAGRPVEGFETADRVLVAGSALRPPHAIRGNPAYPRRVLPRVAIGGHTSDPCSGRHRRRWSVRVLIVGGGVIGAAIAYFLSRRGAQVVVVERTGVACAASGKSGGFLALDWCDGTPLEPLARRSFALHARLAEEIGVDWGYRPLDTFGGVVPPSSRRQHDVDWVSDRVAFPLRLGSQETTAQVHPARFTHALMHAAEAQGAELRIGRVEGVLRDPGRQSVVGLQVDGEKLLGDAVVIAMGPWSILASKWLPLPAVFGLKGHSIVFDTGSAVPAEALFLESVTGSARCRPRCSREATAQLTSAVFPARAKCQSIQPRWCPIRARSKGCTTSAPSYRRCSRAVRCSRGRLASGR